MTKSAKFLRLAIDLARQSLNTEGCGPFGAVITRDGQIVGEGWNQVVALNDPTAHAEMVAIREACRRLATFSLKGCTLYASCEPCPMCLAAIYWARIDKVIFAATRQDAAEAGFDDGYFYEEICRAPEAREIPMEQRLQEEAGEVFRLWLKNPERKQY